MSIRTHFILVASLLAAISISIPAARGDASLPPIPPGAGLGVNIHFTDPQPGEMEMIAAAGFKWVRMDLSWEKTEPKTGYYDFSAYDRLLAALDKQKMHAILILDYGNPLYEKVGVAPPGGTTKGTPEFRVGFSNWAAAAVSHFAHRGCIWEMWNEPNGANFWPPTPNVGEYISLAKITAAALRGVAPNEPLIGPGTSGIDFNFLEACFKAGLLEDWAAVSVHPYRQSDPSSASADFQRLKGLIAEYGPKGKAIPIISSEWGYSTAWSGFDDQKQAKYLATEFSTNIANGIPLSIWYDWRDDGDNPRNPEHRFGLVRREYHAGREPVYDPKAAYDAMKAFAAQPPHP